MQKLLNMSNWIHKYILIKYRLSHDYLWLSVSIRLLCWLCRCTFWLRSAHHLQRQEDKQIRDERHGAASDHKENQCSCYENSHMGGLAGKSKFQEGTYALERNHLSYKLLLAHSMQCTHGCVHLTQWLEMFQGPNTDCCLGRLGTYLSPLSSWTPVHPALSENLVVKECVGTEALRSSAKPSQASKASIQTETIAVRRNKPGCCVLSRCVGIKCTYVWGGTIQKVPTAKWVTSWANFKVNLR